MLATTTHFENLNSRTVRFIPRANLAAQTSNRLARTDFSRDARLLDASVAGVVLSFCPRDEEMRAKAQLSWNAIRALLADDLFTEANVMPWHDDASVGSATASAILWKRYSELRALARTIAAVSFEEASDGKIAEAGQALCRLAVKLDDLMEGTHRRLLNKLRQYVFCTGEEVRMSA